MKEKEIVQKVSNGEIAELSGNIPEESAENLLHFMFDYEDETQIGPHLEDILHLLGLDKQRNYVVWRKSESGMELSI